MSPARERFAVVLLLLALGAVGVLASTQPFTSVVLEGGVRPLIVAGSEAAPALAPLGLAQLALAGALTIAGRIARVVLGAVLVVLGAAVVALLLPLVADPVSGAAGAIADATGVTGTAGAVRSLTATAWPVVAIVAGVLGALTGVLVIARSRRWTTGGRRFRQEGAAPVRATDPVSEWDALTRGGDPTDDRERGGAAP